MSLDLAAVRRDLASTSRPAMDRKLDVHLPAAVAEVERLRKDRAELAASLIRAARISECNPGSPKYSETLQALANHGLRIDGCWCVVEATS